MNDMNNSCGTGGCCGMSGSDKGGQCGGSCGSMGGRHHGFHKKPFMVLLILALAVWVGLKARNEAREFDYIGVPLERNVISISGEGKVVGVPDIATVDLGSTVEKKTVAEAQAENTRVMNALIEKLKAADVAKADIQTTSYSVYPNYDWNNGKQSLRSYSVTQNVHVKVRDLSKVGDIIGMAGDLGANQIGGISFTVDKPEALKAEARDKAIADAKSKAESLAKAAGITLKKIVSYSEGQDAGYPQPVFFDKMGVGGAEMRATAPTVEAGSSEFVSNITITYEIR